VSVHPLLHSGNGLNSLSNTIYAILEQQVSEIHGADAMNTCTRCEQLAEKICKLMTLCKKIINIVVAGLVM
jgi:hypothetical protein